MKSLFLQVGTLGSAMAVVYACCEEIRLDFGKLRGTFSFSLDVALDIEFDAEMAVDFDWDWSAWSGVRAASDINLDFDFSSGFNTYEQTLRIDIDDDGVLETVTFLGVSSSSPDDVARGFATWRGDKYTYDSGICYLMTWGGGQSRILSAPCGEDGPAAVCSVGGEDGESASCEACEASGNCASCPSENSDVEECLSDVEDELSPGSEPGGGSGGVGGSPGSSSGGSSSGPPDLEICEAFAVTLSAAGVSCGEAPLDTDEICASSPNQVEVCLAAVEFSGLFDSPCSVLNSASCGGIY